MKLFKKAKPLKPLPRTSEEELAELEAELQSVSTNTREMAVQEQENRERPSLMDRIKNIGIRLSNTVKRLLQGVAGAFGINLGFDLARQNNQNESEQHTNTELNPDLLAEQNVTPEQLATISPPLTGPENASINKILENGGPHPLQVIALLNHRKLRNVERSNFLQTVAEICFSAEAQNLPIEMILPLSLATVAYESNFNYRAQTGSHIGLYQHKERYWPGRIEDNEQALRSAGLWESHIEGRTPQETILDTQIQSFVSVSTFRDHFSRFSSGNMRNYNPDTFARDIYLVHNLGGAHAWVVDYLNGDISRQEFDQLYRERNGERTQDGRTFKDYAYRKATRAPEDQTWNKVQNAFNDFRRILYIDDVTNV